MQYFRPIKLNCPVCGAKNSLEYRYTPATQETEGRCTICHSNWIDKRRLGEKAVKDEYRRNVENEFYARNRRDRPKNNKSPQDPEIKELLTRLDHIRHHV